MPIITRKKAIENFGVIPGKWYLHTILFDSSRWSLPECREWLRKHEYKMGVRVKGSQYRFNQVPEVKDALYSTKKTNDGIYLVFSKFNL